MIVHLMYLAILFVLLVIQHFERKDLYNRIMSKNLTEYKSGGNYRVKSAHDKIIERWRGKGGDHN